MFSLTILTSAESKQFGQSVTFTVLVSSIHSSLACHAALLNVADNLKCWFHSDIFLLWSRLCPEDSLAISPPLLEDIFARFCKRSLMFLPPFEKYFFFFLFFFLTSSVNVTSEVWPDFWMLLSLLCCAQQDLSVCIWEKQSLREPQSLNRVLFEATDSRPVTGNYHYFTPLCQI